MSRARVAFLVWLSGTAMLVGIAAVVLTKQFRASAPAETKQPSTDRAALSEKEKISALLDDLAGSQAKFIRNGTEYSGAQAADHLRRKWRAAGERITTSREFIDALASRSSSSGDAYRVRDGESTTDSGAWFLARLEAIERAHAGAGVSGSGQTLVGSADGAGAVLALLRESPDRFRIVESDEIEIYTGRQLARRIGLKHTLAGSPVLPVDAFIDQFCTTSSLHGTLYEVDGTPPIKLADWVRAKVVR